jgi:HUS1 checkpoint protein
LKSAQNASHASIRLTKKNNIPLLCITITTVMLSGPLRTAVQNESSSAAANDFGYDPDRADDEIDDEPSRSTRETIITHDIPIKVLPATSIAGLDEPTSREPDVHITLPPLSQLKSISDRFTKLAFSSTKPENGTSSSARFRGNSSKAPRLELSANMHGCLRLRLKTDAMDISSRWTGLSNPELDPETVEGGEEGIAQHPSTIMRSRGDAEGRSEDGWSVVRLDGKDWGKVLGVGRLGGRVIACEFFFPPPLLFLPLFPFLSALTFVFEIPVLICL